MVKKLPANAGDIRDLSSVPASGRSSGEGNGNPLQYSCLENPMDRGAHRVTESWTQLMRLSMHASRHLADSLSAESSLSGSRTAVFSLCPHVAREFSGVWEDSGGSHLSEWTFPHVVVCDDQVSSGRSVLPTWQVPKGQAAAPQ